MYEEIFAGRLTNEQTLDFLKRYYKGKNITIISAKEIKDENLRKYHDIFSRIIERNGKKTVKIVVFRNNEKERFISMRDDGATMYEILEGYMADGRKTVVEYNRMIEEEEWRHFMYLSFKDEYEKHIRERRIIERQAREEDLKRSLVAFDNETKKIIENMKK